MVIKAKCCLQQSHHLVDFREPDAKIKLPNLQSASTAAPPECKAPLSGVQHTGGERVSKLLPQNRWIPPIQYMDSLYIYLLM